MHTDTTDYNSFMHTHKHRVKTKEKRELRGRVDNNHICLKNRQISKDTWGGGGGGGRCERVRIRRSKHSLLLLRFSSRSLIAVIISVFNFAVYFFL